MNSAIRFFSVGGKTRDVAEEISSIAGVPAEPLEKALEGPVDVLFIGAGVYEVALDKKVLDYISQLDKSKVGAVALFSTSSGDNVTDQMALAASDNGIPLKGNPLQLVFGIKNFGIGYKFGLTKEDKEKIADFVKAAL